jgi:hypothetical protein
MKTAEISHDDLYPFLARQDETHLERANKAEWTTIRARNVEAKRQDHAAHMEISVHRLTHKDRHNTLSGTVCLDRAGAKALAFALVPALQDLAEACRQRAEYRGRSWYVRSEAGAFSNTPHATEAEAQAELLHAITDALARLEVAP